MHVLQGDICAQLGKTAITTQLFPVWHFHAYHGCNQISPQAKSHSIWDGVCIAETRNLLPYVLRYRYHYDCQQDHKCITVTV